MGKVLCSATRSSSSFSSDFVRGFFISKSFITSKSSKCLIIPQIINMAEYRVEPRGSLYNDNFRLFFKNGNGELISPMHDIPMAENVDSNEFNMVVEVPRWSNAKMEINLKGQLNPIKQDVKKGKLRFVANCFPPKGYIWNYGTIPQTWEDPDHIDAHTNCKGDGDPIDVCEIGTKVHKPGSVIRVKVLGTLAMIDEGETDWKILAIDVTDEMAPKLNDIEDIENHMPGFIAATVEWFKIFKMPDGNPANEFAFNAMPKNKEFALNIVKSLHEQWKSMMGRDMGPDGVSRDCTIYECNAKVAQENAKATLEAQASPGDDNELADSVDKWHYVKL